jgi:hypothetical protein
VAVASLHRSQPGIRELLVEYRNRTITHELSDVGLLSLNSSELVERGFLTDSADAVADWRPVLTSAARVPGDGLLVDDIGKVEAIVNSFSRGGGERPIYFMPLLERIASAQQASGYCSDHVKIFMALGRAYGVFAREVQNDVTGLPISFRRRATSGSLSIPCTRSSRPTAPAPICRLWSSENGV